jgi:hypothetical protein
MVICQVYSAGFGWILKIRSPAREKWAHFRDRAKERQISREDLFALAEWKAEDPDVPDGEWYKDFGTFKL